MKRHSAARAVTKSAGCAAPPQSGAKIRQLGSVCRRVRSAAVTPVTPKILEWNLRFGGNLDFRVADFLREEPPFLNFADYFVLPLLTNKNLQNVAV